MLVHENSSQLIKNQTLNLITKGNANIDNDNKNDYILLDLHIHVRHIKQP